MEGAYVVVFTILLILIGTDRNIWNIVSSGTIWTADVHASHSQNTHMFAYFTPIWRRNTVKIHEKYL